MPRYAPLPIVSIDPRNESELAQQAAQVVYEASNQTLNDFSAGNPLAVLIEGQSFAQGEFLFWANQLPEKILIEWIGPFLGAMRRLGTPATALLEISTEPSATPTPIPVGTIFTTNPELTGGQSLEFVSYEDLTVPAGTTLSRIPVYSKYVGNIYNVPANTITGFSNDGGTVISATNPQPAVGGSDVETYEEVKERFFTLIRRRNPVSESDWQDFFEDLFGVGTLTSVQPNRSSEYIYNYETDYNTPNGKVAFFVLNSDGTELTEDQIRTGQNAINFSVPIENKGYLFPIKLSPVHFELTLSVNPNGGYGRDFKQSSLNFRNRLFDVLTPGKVFPVFNSPTVSDIDSAFYATFPEGERFSDPRVTSSKAYNTPVLLGGNTSTYTSLSKFEPTSQLIVEGDLVVVSSPNPVYYPALADFTPYSSSKLDQTIYGNLELKQIKSLIAGSFSRGDIVYYDGSLNPEEEGLHVVLENLTVNTNREVLESLESGRISDKKEYKSWTVGADFVHSQGGTLDPDIVGFDYTEGSFTPSTPESVSLSQRPGGLAWLVAKNFTLQTPTNDITGAQASFQLGGEVEPQELEEGAYYQSGTWVFTPQIGSGPNSLVDPYFHYVDSSKGATTKFAKVMTNFSASKVEEKMSDYFDRLVEEGVLKQVNVHDGQDGLPIYKYKPRFKTGQYLEYKSSTFGEPRYFIACYHFTPDTSDVFSLESRGLIINLTPSQDLRAQFEEGLKSGFTGQIGNLIIEESGFGYQNGSYNNVPIEGGDGFGATAQIVVSEGEITYAVVKQRGQMFRTGDLLTIDNSHLGGSGSGVALRVTSVNTQSENTLLQPVRMFTFFKGDRTFFRSGTNTYSFTATSAVTPLFDFSVYYRNGVFVKSHDEEGVNFTSEQYIPYYHPSYPNYAEDTLVDDSGRSYYRVMKAFTPSEQIVSWRGIEEPNSCRYEEYSKNLLRYVTEYSCEETVLPQTGDDTSSIKLGSCNINIISSSVGQVQGISQESVYVWENTYTSLESPQLSWFTGTAFPLTPPNYSGGTLAL